MLVQKQSLTKSNISLPAPIQYGSESASTYSVEQQALAAKLYIALLQLKGERKRLIDDIVDLAAKKLEDPAQP